MGSGHKTAGIMDGGWGQGTKSERDWGGTEMADDGGGPPIKYE